MIDPSRPVFFEQQTLGAVSPQEMDALWANGWRHFGRDFFRYTHSITESEDWHSIQPLRIPLADFSLTKSQRRILRKNEDVTAQIVPASVDPEREALFQRHKKRFVRNIPETLRVFMPESEPYQCPCECVSVEVRHNGELIAVSYLDVGADSVSSVYAMFAPEAAARSMGTYTMIREILWAKEAGKRYLYPGYATLEPSHYDYKKLLRPIDCFDWVGNWVRL